MFQTYGITVFKCFRHVVSMYVRIQIYGITVLNVFRHVVSLCVRIADIVHRVSPYVNVSDIWYHCITVCKCFGQMVSLYHCVNVSDIWYHCITVCKCFGQMASLYVRN